MILRSFRARLIIGAFIWISIGLAVSGLVLAELFREIVIIQFDHDLSDHAEELAALVDLAPQQSPSVHRDLSDPRFLPTRSGLYWQVQHQSGATIRSPSLGSLDLPFDGKPGNTERLSNVDGPTGPMRFFQKRVMLRDQKELPVIGVAVEKRLIDEAMTPLNIALAWSLAMIAVGLIIAACAQVAYGLRPLARIRQAVIAVRSGRIQRLPDGLPTEVLPLVTELNHMIAANQDMVRRARIQAANLAHALKTPLTILMDAGRELELIGQSDAARVLLEQCKRMQAEIEYQTARARASMRANAAATTSVAPIIKDVISAMSLLRHDRAIAFELVGTAELAVACDPHDLSEMSGNLIDNAAKWAGARVVISIVNSAKVVRILVEDDGPGIPAEHCETVFHIGSRLDERKPGSGLGLAITRDLAALYGGRAWIERSRLGGVAAYLELNPAT